MKFPTPEQIAAWAADRAAIVEAYEASPKAADDLAECVAARAARLAEIDADHRRDVAQRRREEAAAITTIRSQSGRSYSFRARPASTTSYEVPHLERLMSTGGL